MISIAILTHNAVPHLKELLPTLSWASEIVIVDDHSTDETKEIAQQFHAKFFTRSLNQDFAAQRNFALSTCKEDWILFLDPDEQVPNKLRKEIITTLKGNSLVDGFFLKRQDIFFGRKLKFGETGFVRLLRLGRRRAGKWVRPVHEVWEIKNAGELKHHLLHHPHPTITSFLQKINWYTEIEANYRKSQGERFNLLTLCVYPLVKFLVNYFLKLGFLNGFPGFTMAFMMSLNSFITRVKLYQLIHENQSRD